MFFRTLLAFALLTCLPLRAEVDQIPPAAREFVANFYRWYVPFAHADHAGPAFTLALKRDPSIFSAELFKALRGDAAAQAKVSGEIAGLDSDPFLSSQDPDERYELGDVSTKGNRYLFALHGVSAGQRQPQPTVIAEVEQKSGRWIFVNFRSADGSDLLTTLNKLKASRREKRPK